MKPPFVAFALALAFSSPVLGLTPGDVISPDALSKADFVQGEPPTVWEPGKVYVLECWATWCGPCITAIPHVDGLYDKYHDKGLHVIGVNVFEDGREKVAAFVEKKGAGMSYPIAYVGKGGAFEGAWLKPAGVNSIPHAFVVKDGQLLFSIHPGSLTEKTVEALLAGGQAEAAELEKLRRANDGKGAVEQLIAEFTQQIISDVSAAESTLEKIRRIDENNAMLGYLGAHVAIAKKDWKRVSGIIRESKGPITTRGISMIASSLPIEMPASVLSVLEEKIKLGMEGPEVSPLDRFSLASIQWKLGKKDDAAMTAERAAAGFRQHMGKGFSASALNAYVDSFKQGEPMSLNELLVLAKEPN